MEFKGVNQKEYFDKIVKFSDIKTRYPLLEVILSNKNCTNIKVLGLGYKMKFDMYYNYRVLSTRDFPDTYTTRVILWDKKLEVE